MNTSGDDLFTCFINTLKNEIYSYTKTLPRIDLKTIKILPCFVYQVGKPYKLLTFPELGSQEYFDIGCSVCLSFLILVPEIREVCRAYRLRLGRSFEPDCYADFLNYYRIELHESACLFLQEYCSKYEEICQHGCRSLRSILSPCGECTCRCSSRPAVFNEDTAAFAVAFNASSNGLLMYGSDCRLRLFLENCYRDVPAAPDDQDVFFSRSCALVQTSGSGKTASLARLCLDIILTYVCMQEEEEDITATKKSPFWIFS